MPIVATSARRQTAMAVMIGLAVAGGVMRHYAPNPSMLRDLSSLLMVMWLPAVGNLVAWLVRKLPRAAPPPTDFPPGRAFSPQLRVELRSVPLPAGLLEALDPAGQLATLLVGRHGFTVRAEAPMARWLAMATGRAPGETGAAGTTQAADAPVVEFECLRPERALKALMPGTQFHVLVGTDAVASGRVLSQASVPGAPSDQ